MILWNPNHKKCGLWNLLKIILKIRFENKTNIQLKNLNFEIFSDEFSTIWGQDCKRPPLKTKCWGHLEIERSLSHDIVIKIS